MQATEFFRQVHQRALPVVIDEPRLAGFIQALGFEVRHYDEHDFTVEHGQPTLVILTSMHYHDRHNQLWERARDVVSHVALAKFDTSLECLRYSVDQLLSANHEDTLRRRASYYDLLLSTERVEVLTPGARLVCEFEEEVEVANDDSELEVGWLYSAAEFFETSIINLESDRSSFCADGEQAFDGVLFLANNDEVKEEFGGFVEELRARAAAGGGRATWAENRLVRLELGGEDVTAPFQAMCEGRERGTSATEFAVGCVEFPAGLDWRFNSVLNEGVHGVHLGIGMGQQIPHLDFVSVGATLRALGAP